MRKTIIGGVLLLLLSSCSGSSSSEPDKIPALRIEESFDITELDEISGKIHVINVFRPEFTDSSMFNCPQILRIADGKAYLHEDKFMTTFSYPDGKLLSAFNHYGSGPEDYTYSYYAYYTPEDNGTWTVLNTNFGIYKIMQYDAEGNFRRSTDNDTIQSLAPLPDGSWLGFNEAHSRKGEFRKVRERVITHYSADWKRLSADTIKMRRSGIVGGDFMDQLNIYNGQVYAFDADTVIRYDAATSSFVPALALLEGKYFYDWSLPNTTKERDAAEADHLPLLHPTFNDRYAFVSYYYGPYEKAITRSDVYDITTGRLVFRKEFTRDENIMLNRGLPVELDGHTLSAWPAPIVIDNHFFLIVSAEEMSSVTGTDNVNPVILEVEIQ